jgi:hypothetical protein
MRCLPSCLGPCLVLLVTVGWACLRSSSSGAAAPADVPLLPYQQALKAHYEREQVAPSPSAADDFVLYMISRNRYTYLQSLPFWVEAVSHASRYRGSIVLLDAASDPPLPPLPSHLQPHVQLIRIPPSALLAPRLNLSISGYSFWESLAFAVAHAYTERMFVIDNCTFPPTHFNLSHFVYRSSPDPPPVLMPAPLRDALQQHTEDEEPPVPPASLHQTLHPLTRSSLMVCSTD